ncbi:MAG: hypothetical protein Q9188_002835, partial [Gyalolechia gomerana]
GRRGSCLVADADLGGGFGEDEIGDAGVVHVDGAELVAGFDDGEHACIAEVFAVTDVEVLENGGAGGLGKVLEDAVGDVFYFFHVEVGQEWGVFEKVLECIVGQSEDVGDLEAGEFWDIVCQASDSLVVELMAPAEVEVSEVARRYDCSVGQRNFKSFVIDIAVGYDQPFQSVTLEQILYECLIIPASGLACFEFFQFGAGLDNLMKTLCVQMIAPRHIEIF